MNPDGITKQAESANPLEVYLLNLQDEVRSLRLTVGVWCVLTSCVLLYVIAVSRSD